MNKKSIKQKRIEQSFVWRMIDSAPVAMGFSIITFVSSNIVLLLLQSFRNELIFGVSLPIAIVSFCMVMKVHRPISLESSILSKKRFFSLAVMLFVVGWGFLNMQYNAQTVYLYRDPGLYNTTSKWLTENNDIVIPNTKPFGGNDNVYASSNSGVNALDNDSERLYTHGLHALPVLSSSVARVTNDSYALKTNVLVASIALLVFFSFSCKILKPEWAFLATITLGLSLPFIHFSRDMYTEPLSLLFFFTSLCLLHNAAVCHKSRQKLVWFLAGISTGAILTVRIDGYIAIIGVIVALLLRSLLQVNSKRFKLITQENLLFALGLGVQALIGYLNLRLLSAYYFNFHQELFQLQLMLLGIVLLTGMLFIGATRMMFVKGRITKSILKKISVGRVGFFAVLFLTMGVLLILGRGQLYSEINYYEVQEIAGTEAIVVQNIETEDSVAYDTGENTMRWAAWYLGPLVALTSLLGLFLMAYRIGEKSVRPYLPFVLSIWIMGLLYFVRPSITPDQVWASRRFLPVVFPGLIIFSFYFLSSVQFKKRYREVLYYATVLIIAVSGVLSTSGFYLKERVDYTSLDQVTDVCDEVRVSENPAILVIGLLGLTSVQTFSSYCQVPVNRYDGSPSRAEFASFYAEAIANGYSPYVVLFNRDRGLLPEGSLVTNFEEYELKTIEKVFEKAPSRMNTGYKEIIYGSLMSNGSLGKSE